MSNSLPEYERPPVTEVAISLQFKPLEGFRSPHFGLLWQILREVGFSRIEEHGELQPEYEEFDRPPRQRLGIKIEAFNETPPLPRVWFLDEKQNELVQIQRNRLIVNWRQGAGSEPYPRYSHIIKRFDYALATFTNFVGAERIGEILPEQCELTYVNIIPLEREWSHHSDLAEVLTMWTNRTNDDYLPTPEDINSSLRFRMRDSSGRPIGRLHVVLQSAYRLTDQKPVFTLTFTARGKPNPQSIEGARQLFDLEHEWIVNGFTSITTRRIQDFWGRVNGD